MQRRFRPSQPIIAEHNSEPPLGSAVHFKVILLASGHQQRITHPQKVPAKIAGPKTGPDRIRTGGELGFVPCGLAGR